MVVLGLCGPQPPQPHACVYTDRNIVPASHGDALAARALIEVVGWWGYRLGAVGGMPVWRYPHPSAHLI